MPVIALTVKRSDMSSLDAALTEARSNLAYSGSASFSGVDAEGSQISVSIAFTDESQPDASA